MTLVAELWRLAMASTECALKRVSSRNELATSLEAAFRGHGRLWSYNSLLTFSIGVLFAASVAGYVLYLTAIDRPQEPLMVLVGFMAASELLAGMLLGVVFFARHSMTEKLRQKEARESERRHQALFDHAPLGLGLTTADGRILAHNEALSKMLDYRRKDPTKLDARSIYWDPEYRSRQILTRLKKQSSN